MTPAEPAIELRSAPDPEFLRPIGEGLRAYNDAQVGPARREWFALRATAADGTVVGGVYGWLMGGWLYVDWLWVHESARRARLGATLLARAEAYGREQGMRFVRLETASWQALPFYRKQGYEVFAELPIDTPDSPGTFAHREYFLKKGL